MRFLTEEYREISKIMDELDLTYSLVKRKGWVYIDVDGKSFAFHREKTTQLTNGKLVDSHHYSIRTEGKAQQPVNDFQEVIQKLQELLNK